MHQTTNSELTDTEVAAFRRDGFLVVRALASETRCRALQDEVDRCLDPPLGPLELEAELGYPGAPNGMDSVGGKTPRRLLNAFSRGPLFREWACAPKLVTRVAKLIGETPIGLVQAHHNCVMTKYPRFGSETGWHQDVRYWSFAEPTLINAWLALGPEGPSTGGLRVVPGSHTMDFTPAQFDDALFFRPELDTNRTLIDSAIDVELDRGDVLFFHCRLLHAAGRNLTEQIKRSLVFTYNATRNLPEPYSRSARLAQIPL